MTDRKSRLAALAAKAGRSKARTSSGTTEKQASASQPTVVFRNYTPSNKTLAGEESSNEPDTKRQKQDEPSVLQLALQRAKEQPPLHTTPIQHKKLNWDLKKDIQPKLDKLEKRTQKAIVALLRERLENEAAHDDLD